MIQTEWDFRNAIELDLSFIYQSWLKSFRYNSETMRGIRNHIYFPQYNRVIDWILSQEDTKTIVASHREYPETVFGYIVYQPKIVHYLYVKKDFSKKYGIGKSLWDLTGQIPTYSHRTSDLVTIIKNHPEWKTMWDPFSLFHQIKGEENGGQTTYISKIS